MSVGLHSLVTDWGGFERFVADLHGTGDFDVQRDVVLPARDGGTYQIDVLLTSRAGPYVYRTLVSCKYWKRNVSRTEINDLIQARAQVGAQKAICFTSSGFQDPSAVAAARAENIDLYVVKDLLPTDWGSPAIITFVLQLAEVGLSLSLTAPIVSLGPPPPADWLTNVDPAHVSVSLPNGTADGTMAERCAKMTANAWEKVQSRNCTYSGGVELVFDQVVSYARCAFEGGPRMLRHGAHAVTVENFTCDAVVRIHQRPLVVDRSKMFEFSVVVEDYLNNARTIVSRRSGENATWQPAPTGVAATPSSDVVTSDTLLVAALLRGPLPSEEVSRVLRATAAQEAAAGTNGAP